MVNGKTFGATLWRYRNFLIIVFTAVLLLPLPLLIPGQESKCGYLMLVMGIYWCTEALPLSVTGMIPIFTMPMLGLLKSEDIAVLYMQEATLMFFGGLMVALAFEKCNLHKRIALGVLVMMGTKPIWLMLGFMLPTWFLSMWISNTATTSMMIPILEAVLLKLSESLSNKRRSHSRAMEGHDNHALDDLAVTVSNGDITELNTDLGYGGEVRKRYTSTGDAYQVTETKGNSFDLEPSSQQSENSDDHNEKKTEQESNNDPKFRKLCKGMTLAVAYAANIGGTGTLTGTAPNVIMKEFADDLWKKNLCVESPVNFSSWMVYGVPTSIITLFLIWLWLAIYHLGPNGFRVCFKKAEDSEADINSDIKREFKELGRMKYSEWFTLFIFTAMVLLWFFRSPGFITGWGDILNPGFIKDSVPSIMCTVALFVLPMFPPRWGSEKEHGKAESLLDWQIVHERFPWGIIFLVGGGFCLAEAAISSGLSDVVAEALTVFEVLPDWFMTTVVAFFTSLLTEITSNTATSTIIMPIVATMAEKLALNPLYLMFPCSVATSYAFMLPVATPPNAIAFSYGRIAVLDMVKAGAVLKLCVFVLTLGTETWGMAYFNFDEPAWDNNTLPCGIPTAVLV